MVHPEEKPGHTSKWSVDVKKQCSFMICSIRMIRDHLKPVVVGSGIFVADIMSENSHYRVNSCL